MEVLMLVLSGTHGGLGFLMVYDQLVSGVGPITVLDLSPRHASQRVQCVHEVISFNLILRDWILLVNVPKTESGWRPRLPLR